MIDLILGTAGHIDHGKTSLVRALTGVDTDRLPEEKRRGITIELGFAELVLGEYRLGIVDVPGHERFVRHMLAGATGMDLAMLVVAADDSVKPQTREHVEILRMLDLPAGVIAVTKCDLVAPGWLELVVAEIRELLAGSFLEAAPLVAVSSVTGAGLDELRRELTVAAERAARYRAERMQGPFRLAIDRAFTMAGYGTVVTGSVSSGRVRVGDELVLEPGSVRVRVRGLQNHDRTVQEVHRGQRAAINLAGVRHDEIHRGQELAAPGHLRASRRLTIKLDLLPNAPRPLKSRSRVRLHVGTAELLTTAVVLGQDQLNPGASAFAQLMLAEPVAVVWGQPLVIRSESPVTTIGGGRVLNPDAERISRVTGRQLARLADLGASDPLARASAALYFAGLRAWEPADLARLAGIEDTASVYAALRDRGDVREIAVSPTRLLRVHSGCLDEFCDRVASRLDMLHSQSPLRTEIDTAQLSAAFHYLAEPALFDAALETLRESGRVRRSPRGVALAGRGPQLSQNERKLLERLIDQYRRCGIQSPTVDQLRQQAPHNQQSVPHLVALAAANGDLVHVAGDFFLHAEVDRSLQAQLRQSPLASRALTVSEIREILNTSRKYAVPYCEYLDRIGVTRREGDLRMLATSDQP